MKKIIYLLSIFVSLLVGCSNNLENSDSKIYEGNTGYDYVINKKEDSLKTYSFFGEKMKYLLKKDVQEEYEERLIFIDSYTKLDNVMIDTFVLSFDLDTKVIMNIFNQNYFQDNYLGIIQRKEDYDSIDFLDCIYSLIIKIQPTYSGSGFVGKEDFYLEENRYFTSRKNQPQIVNNYILDFIVIPREKATYALRKGEYGAEKRIDYYEKELIVEKKDIEYLYNKKDNSYSVYKVNGENFEILSEIKNKPVKKILPNAFSYNQKLEFIKIPKNITKICNSSFQGCFNLKGIEFDNDSLLEVIGRKAFNGTLLTHIIIPSSCERILFGAFANCVLLRNVGFSEKSNLKELDNKVFYNCSSLEGINLIEGIETIGDQCFYNTYMVYAYIPSSVTYLGAEVFSGDNIVEKVQIKIDYRLDKIPSSWNSYWNKNLVYEINYNKLPK